MELLSFSKNAIDIHSHFNHGSPYDASENEFHYRNLSFLKSEYERFGIRIAAYSTYAAVLEHYESILCENNYLKQVVENDKSMFQWVVIDPRQKGTLVQAEKILSSPKCLGIKIHPDSHGYDIEEYADLIFDFADSLHATVLMHPQKCEMMPRYVNNYPNMRLIIAHLGGSGHLEAIKNARYENIFTDTSGMASRQNNVIEYAVQTVGAEKILFGTDTYSLAFQYGRIVFSSISDADKEKILFENSLRMFAKLRYIS